jgi:hypothetical protein
MSADRYFRCEKCGGVTRGAEDRPPSWCGGCIAPQSALVLVPSGPARPVRRYVSKAARTGTGGTR